MAKPTREDAHLLLELSGGFPRESWMWFSAQFKAKNYSDFDKKYPRGSVERARVQDLISFFELSGILVSHGLLNEDLFFDLSFGLRPFWDKIALIISGWQKATHPSVWENAVWLAKRYEWWGRQVWKPNLGWKLKSGSNKKQKSTRQSRDK